MLFGSPIALYDRLQGAFSMLYVSVGAGYLPRWTTLRIGTKRFS